MTLAIQLYRNVEIYELNKRQIRLEALQLLNKSIEKYYTDQARNSQTQMARSEREISERIFRYKNYESPQDSLANKRENDSLDSNDAVLQELKKKIALSSIINETVMATISVNLAHDFDEIGLAKYNIQLLNSMNFESGGVQELTNKLVSNSPYLPDYQKVVLNYQFENRAVLQRGATDLLFSLLILTCIVSSLIVLYRMIYRQKELAEIRNDLLDNITHEFKTPIAAGISTLEGLTLYNKDNDPIKNLRYAGLAIASFNKINGLVDKLLETASLESEHSNLKSLEFNLSDLVNKLVKKHSLLLESQTITTSVLNELTYYGDEFHLEHVIDNLLENAIKYGGQSIHVVVRKDAKFTLIEVSDNGDGIEKKHQPYVFDKFYRVHNGNLHDVKGYGIGLYYSKKMVEQHGGRLTLKSNREWTSFKITLQ